MSILQRIAAGFLLALAAVFFTIGVRQHFPVTSNCMVIHRPKKGCPPGYTQESEPRFTEKDGSKKYACISQDRGREICIDFLDPGESATYAGF